MKGNWLTTIVATLFITILSTSATAQSTAFTYQGRLQHSGANANGTYDFQFTLWDSLSGGTQQPQPSPTIVTKNGVAVVNGVFTVQIDFGATAFPGADRFLETSVRSAGGGAFTLLSPRQPLNSTPYAVRSASSAKADTATTANNATQLGGVSASNYLQSVSRTSSLIGSGTGSSPLSIAVPLQLTGTLNVPVISAFNDSGQGSGVYGLSTDSGDEYGGVTGESPGDGVIGRGGRAGVFGFSSTGNGVYGNSASSSFAGVAGFNSTTGAAVSGLSQNGAAIFGQSTNGFAGLFVGKSYFNGNVGIGTSNPTAKLQVNSGDIIFGTKWRTETTTINSGSAEGPPNLIGGFQGNGSGPGNRVTPSVVGAVIGGGGFNGTIMLPRGTITVGDNTNRVTDWFGTVGGGWANHAGNDNGTLDDALSATVAGGFFNVAGGESSTVGGGVGNNATGRWATVPGGNSNSAIAELTFAAGFHAKANHAGTFVWGDASTNADFASSGSNQFLIRAAGGVGIGTTSPVGRLNVVGSGGAAQGIQFDDREIKFRGDGIAHFSIFANRVSGNLTIENTSSSLLTGTPGTIALSIASSGNVGLGGVTSATSKLQVNGQGRFSTVNIDSYVSGQNLTLCTASSGGNQNIIGLCSSSLRYKTNVQSYRKGLEIIGRLRPISFDWKEAGTHDVGLAAEEVEKVEPLFTFRNQKGEIEGVRYSQLSAIFINAFKEQQALIEQQQTQLTQQAEQIKRQEDQARKLRTTSAAQQQELDALKSLVCRLHRRATVCR